MLNRTVPDLEKHIIPLNIIDTEYEFSTYEDLEKYVFSHSLNSRVEEKLRPLDDDYFTKQLSEMTKVVWQDILDESTDTPKLKLASL